MKMAIIKTRQIEGIELFCSVMNLPKESVSSRTVGNNKSVVEYDDKNWKLEKYIDMLIKIDEGS